MSQYQVKPVVITAYLLKRADTKRNSGNRNKAADKTVEDKDQERHFVIFYFKTFVNGCTYDLDQEKKRKDGKDAGFNPFKRKQFIILAGLKDLNNGIQSPERNKIMVNDLKKIGDHGRRFKALVKQY
jgi:hypothetical protein